MRQNAMMILGQNAVMVLRQNARCLEAKRSDVLKQSAVMSLDKTQDVLKQNAVMDLDQRRVCSLFDNRNPDESSLHKIHTSMSRIGAMELGQFPPLNGPPQHEQPRWLYEDMSKN
ncbi:hypothetical protein Tco_1322883 [Tanacetum coccineum]